MDDYISREAVERFIEKGLNNPDKKKAFGHDAVEILTEVHFMPAADVRPVKRGEWMRKPDPYGFFEDIPVCSECGCTTKMREEYNFCPNCGADMRPEGGADG